MTHRIIYSIQAEADVENLFHAIINEYKSPHTAGRYVQGIYDSIRLLETVAASLPIQTATSFFRFGSNARRINFKKMAIIYTIHGNIVYIHRIIPASMITKL
jgi:plasmid stabilization system protein ParE